VIESVAPGHTRPFGDWSPMPAPSPISTWRGDSMDYGLAVDILLQQTRKSPDVPAGTRIN